MKLLSLIFTFVEDTYWKPDIVDQQEVLVKIMDTYGKVGHTHTELKISLHHLVVG